MVVNATVARAMSEQLDRVNGKPDAAKLLRSGTAKELQNLLDGYEHQLEQLRQQLKNEREWSAQLEAELALCRGADGGLQPDGIQLNHRPVITCAEAAKRCGISVATVNRYLNSAFWQGQQQGNGRWLVYADQSFSRKAKG